MTRLKHEFVMKVKNIENEDASNSKTCHLRKRLQERFSQLVFHKPHQGREIVYAEKSNYSFVAERALGAEDQSDLSETDDDEEEKDLLDDSKLRKESQRVTIKDLYLVALELRNNIRSNSESWYKQWPPVASDISSESVRKVQGRN